MNIRVSGSGFSYSFEEPNGFRPRHASTPRDQSINNVNNEVAEVEHLGGEQFARGANGGRGSGKKKKDEDFEKVGKKVTKITIEHVCAPPHTVRVAAAHTTDAARNIISGPKYLDKRSSETFDMIRY